jgi:hypothetical protein
MTQNLPPSPAGLTKSGEHKKVIDSCGMNPRPYGPEPKSGALDHSAKLSLLSISYIFFLILSVGDESWEHTTSRENNVELTNGPSN